MRKKQQQQEANEVKQNQQQNQAKETESASATESPVKTFYNAILFKKDPAPVDTSSATSPSSNVSGTVGSASPVKAEKH